MLLTPESAGLLSTRTDRPRQTNTCFAQRSSYTGASYDCRPWNEVIVGSVISRLMSDSRLVHVRLKVLVVERD